MILEKSLSGWVGQWELIIQDNKGNIIERTGLKPNLIMDVGLNMFRDLLSGAISDGKIKYIALGSSNVAPNSSQTQLGQEEYRSPITSQSNLSTSGELETIGFIEDTKANGIQVEEIAWFAGANSSDTPNTGIMIARILYSREKTNLESWTLRRVDTIARG